MSSIQVHPSGNPPALMACRLHYVPLQNLPAGALRIPAAYPYSILPCTALWQPTCAAHCTVVLIVHLCPAAALDCRRIPPAALMLQSIMLWQPRNPNLWWAQQWYCSRCGFAGFNAQEALGDLGSAVGLCSFAVAWLWDGSRNFSASLVGCNWVAVTGLIVSFLSAHRTSMQVSVFSQICSPSCLCITPDNILQVR